MLCGTERGDNDMAMGIIGADGCNGRGSLARSGEWVSGVGRKGQGPDRELGAVTQPERRSPFFQVNNARTARTLPRPQLPRFPNVLSGLLDRSRAGQASAPDRARVVPFVERDVVVARDHELELRRRALEDLERGQVLRLGPALREIAGVQEDLGRGFSLATRRSGGVNAAYVGGW